ncbi:hypothetical protein DNU06_13950 [Putridiphycobacter roseus]|uniref:OmpA-like domain-containing protein n=1 Tax=Putridiphycobacter roseus TaxID=2219161 RepID=A0A2W1MWI6_9FLAO|nr:OmpA family protein [Putridiphycobacter roseus]PZE16227.1 hypothetical protein DNU06_13950 [Putridiphycobacter roseus]
MKIVLSLYIILLIAAFGYGQGHIKLVTNYTGEVRKIPGINTSQQDFSAILHDGMVYFASAREPNMINYHENNWSNTHKINMYKGEIKNINQFYDVSTSNITPFFEIQDEYTHVGPISFSVTGDSLFFTKVPRKLIDRKIRVLKPQIYLLKRVNGIWEKNSQLLPFNNPLYSFGHPYFDSKTQTLYFSSNKKGGKGGKDIYQVAIKDGQWEAPVGVKNVNTTANEVFPFVDHEGTIFFSSDKNQGKGGLDVYFLVKNTLESYNVEYLNSSADDFGLFIFESGNFGFLSSNRDGNDDLFLISIKKERNIKNGLFGKLKYRKLNEKIEQPLTVHLLNENRESIQNTLVDENGEFEFFDLKNERDYIVKAKSKTELELVIYDNEGNPDERLLADDNDEFIYRMVDMNDIGDLNLLQIQTDGTAKMAGRFLYEDNIHKDPGVLTVNLLDENGQIAHTILADSMGYFTFKDLPADKNYIIQLEEKNKALTLVIFNETNKIVERLKDDGSGNYLFRKLKVLRINSAKNKNYLREEAFTFGTDFINGDFDKNGNDFISNEGVQVFVYNENNELVDTIFADANGEFKYRKLSGIENYIFKLSELDEQIDMSAFSLKIVDENGDFLKEILSNNSGEFEYRSLDFINVNSAVTMNILEEGSFDLFSDLNQYGGQLKRKDGKSFPVAGIQINVYDKNNVLQVTKSIDADGSFNFDDREDIEGYRFEIINAPADLNLGDLSIAINDFDGELLTEIVANENGEFVFNKLDAIQSKIDKMSNLEENFELIFEISGNYDYDDKEGYFKNKLKVLAYDGNGNLIGEVYTDEKGRFAFRKLPGVSSVLFKLADLEESYDLSKFSLFVEGEDGKQLAKLRSSEKGFFVYKPMGFATPLPLELKEQMDESNHDKIFGNSALDLSSDIESLYYGSNKTQPNSSDLIKLEKMLILMEINTNSTLEINSYADSRASDKYNLILSERRGEWIKSYLVGKGIGENRIVINAYGEGKLVNDCGDGVDCLDKLHALNRRSEVRLIN